MAKPKVHKELVQISYSVPPVVRAAIQEIKLIRLQRNVGRYNGSEVIEDAVMTLRQLEREVAAEYDKTEGEPVQPLVLASVPKPVIVSGAPKYVPLNIPAFEKMPDQVIPNFTDEQIAELLKKVAEGK